MGLQTYIEQRKKTKTFWSWLMLCGYPSFEANMQALEIMADAGVDLVELQFPFLNPVRMARCSLKPMSSRSSLAPP